MTQDPQPPPREHLARAVEVLRTSADQRWDEIAERVIRTAMATTRRSAPVRARGGSGPVWVSEQVLTTLIRRAIADVPGTTPTHIDVATDEAGSYEGVLIVVTVDFGTPVMQAADRIRDRAGETLRQTLGPVTPPVRVEATHVHVADVRSRRAAATPETSGRHNSSVLDPHRRTTP